MSYIIGGNYGALRPDLTPFDLMCAGYTLRHCGEGGAGLCHWRKNPYDPNGRGQMYGICYLDAEDAIRDARWLMTGQRGQMTLQVEMQSPGASA